MQNLKNLPAKHSLEQYVINVSIKLRKEHKLTQQDIAKILNTGNAFIGNVENVKRPAKYNLRHINLLAEHFKVSPTDFFPEKAFK